MILVLGRLGIKFHVLLCWRASISSCIVAHFGCLSGDLRVLGSVGLVLLTWRAKEGFCFNFAQVIMP